MPPDLNAISMARGVYSKNCHHQEAAMRESLTLFPKSILSHDASHINGHSTGTHSYTVAEYGCAQGANSIEPVSKVLSSIPPEGRVSLIFNDTEGNDWNEFSERMAPNLKSWREEAKERSLFSSTVPRSFYEQVVPDDSVDFGYCIASLNHLSRHPGSAGDKADFMHEVGSEGIARADFMSFLSNRARETRAGGSLVLGFVVRAETGLSNLYPISSSLKIALGKMVQEGRIRQQYLESYRNATSAVFAHTKGGIDDMLAKAEVWWTTEECYTKTIRHPAFSMLEEPGNSEAYAKIAVDSVLAPVASYVVKAFTEVEKTCALGSIRDAATMVKELSDETTAAFLREHRDEPLDALGCFIRLKRK